jgi:pimeloyl-ACP methyl ester carboxylesterase
LRAYDVRNRLSELRVPTLFLAADEDHLVPAVAQARVMAERVPGSAFRILDGHGHICLIAPDLDLSQIIREWRGSMLNDER